MDKLKAKNEIERLFQQLSELMDSPENQRRKRMWAPDCSSEAYEPGLIAPFAAGKRKEKRPPVTADWDRLQWSRLLHFDIQEYYTDPLAYLKWTLRTNLYRFQNFPDDTPLVETIPIFLGVAFEPSLFGVPVVYSSSREPLFASEGAVVKKRSDLAKLKRPDFFRSGLMPLAHEFYQEIKELVPEDFSVIFPVWIRGPFGVACGMRSMEDLLVDMIEAPEFVHELMRFITDSRKEYTQQSRKFLGKVEIRNACSENSLANDEVSIPIVSPQLYEELIFPYEDELSEFFGGVNWWHSCGNKTPLVSVIKKMSRSVAFMDFALWADDLRTGVRDLGGAISFHVRPSSGDISERSEEIIKNHVQGIMCMCKGQNFAFRLDSFQPDNAKEADVNTMKRYLSIVKRVGKENLAYTDD